MGIIDKSNKLIDYQITSPVLIYSKKGKKMEAFGFDNGELFSTHYFKFLAADGNTNCIILELLVPMQFCGYHFLKPSKSTITIRKSCVLGVQAVPNVDVNSNLSITYPFSECIQGEFSIAEGFSETTIWQSNLNASFKGNATIVYTSGKEPFIYVALYSLNNKLKTLYKVYKHVPFSFGFTKKTKIIVSKKEVDKKMTGKFQFDVTGELKDKVNLNQTR